MLGATAATSAAVTAASLSNSGAITVGAADQINVTGNFLQSSTGTLTFDSAARPPAFMYGSLTSAAPQPSAASSRRSSPMDIPHPSAMASLFSPIPPKPARSPSTQLPSGSSYAFQQAVNPTYLGVSALPTSLATSVNIATTVGAETPNLVGVNLAYWDDQLTTTQTQSMVEAAGLNIYRFPGGSASDDFHFNVADNYGDPSANTIPQFAQFVARRRRRPSSRSTTARAARRKPPPNWPICKARPPTRPHRHRPGVE